LDTGFVFHFRTPDDPGKVKPNNIRSRKPYSEVSVRGRLAGYRHAGRSSDGRKLLVIHVADCEITTHRVVDPSLSPAAAKNQPKQEEAPVAGYQPKMEEALFAAINKAREAKGLKPLRLDPELQRRAREGALRHPVGPSTVEQYMQSDGWHPALRPTSTRLGVGVYLDGGQFTRWSVLDE
jgi:hypothetical protein